MSDLSSNPLLHQGAAIDFSAVQADHVAPAMREWLARCEQALKDVTADEFPADYDALSLALDVATEGLGRAWGAVGHLNSVADTPALRAAYNELLPQVTDFFTRLGSDERLYAKFKQVMAVQGPSLSSTRHHILQHALRGFVLGGAELQGPAKARFAALQDELAALAQQFSEHVMDATDAFRLYVEEADLAGVPPDVVAAARQAAEADGQSGYKLTLHFPSYFPVMQYAHKRELRETLYRAYATRASEFGDAALDNTGLMQQLLTLKHEEAQLLGYPDAAHTSLATKMASSPQQVMAFLRDLAQKARPYAERDAEQLKAYAAQHLQLTDMQAWDQAYVSEKLKEANYAFNEQALKAYFTEPAVLNGLFGLITALFGVRIVPDSAPVWHPTVRFFRIERDTSAGDATVVGHFYLDLYARPGKRPGAWMDDARGRWQRPDTHQLQTPMAFLVCNFAAPVGDQPALLTHDDVTTLFHEFGHGLHHMLTQVSDLGAAGISGVEWDAVELPSQFMENLCWEWDVLQGLTSHVQTGETLPRELYDKMLAAKNFQSGLQTLRQVEFGLFDMRLHAEPGAQADVQRVIDEVRQEVAVLQPPAYNRFQHSFSHIFSGGYSAGYYSYKWAEVLSADAWAAFEECAAAQGCTPVATGMGQRFLTDILAVGGSRDALESFQAFRGRPPTVDALLRHQGMSDVVGMPQPA